MLHFKGNVQFLFLCNPPRLSASQVCITFLQVTKKILTKKKKTTTKFFLYFQKSARKLTKKPIFLAYYGFLKANYRLFMRLLTLHCFFLTLITIFYVYNTMYSYLFLLFSHFVFLFSTSLSYSSCHETYSTIYNVSYNFITNCP